MNITEVLDDCLEHEQEYWEADLDPSDPANFWIDRATGERVNALTGERTKLEAQALRMP